MYSSIALKNSERQRVNTNYLILFSQAVSAFLARMRTTYITVSTSRSTTPLYPWFHHVHELKLDLLALGSHTKRSTESILDLGDSDCAWPQEKCMMNAQLKTTVLLKQHEKWTSKQTKV